MGRKMRKAGCLAGLIVLMLGAIPLAAGANEREDQEKKEESRIYEVTYGSPDGKNGYYVTAPKVQIRHTDEKNRTVYRLVSQGKTVKKGELTEQDPHIELAKEYYREGLNILYLSMEDEEGNTIEGCSRRLEFWVDTEAPSFKMEAERGFDTWYPGYAEITVEAERAEWGSVVDSIVCYCGTKQIGAVRNAKAGFRITEVSEQGKSIPVTIVVTDRAGNRSEQTRRLYIDRQPPNVQISGSRNYMISGRPVRTVFEVSEENVLKDCVISVERKEGNSSGTPVRPQQWENRPENARTEITLSEDGIYLLRMRAADAAGHMEQTEMQIIIDSKNPLIRYVDQLHGSSRKEFRWDYPQDAFVSDLTSCRTQIYLDGSLYPGGSRIVEEGSHILQIRAADAAGNQTEAKAEFVIDRTPPEIMFRDVEEDGVYEEELAFQICLQDKNDRIENVWINQEKQKIAKDTHQCSFTVREKKDYEVVVSAIDPAGNLKKAAVSFKITEKESVLQKVARPVRTIFVGDSSGEKLQVPEEKSTEKKRVVWLLFLPVIVVFGIFLYKKNLSRR